MNASTLRANWQTTLSGIGTAFFTLLTVIAAMPYQLGDVATIIPAEWKAKVAAGGALAAFVLKVWNSIAAKDANVSGNGTLADPARVPDSKNPGDSRILGVMLAGIGVWFLIGVGCATNTGDPAKDRRGRVTNAVLQNFASDAFQVAMGVLANEVSTVAGGDTKSRDLQQAAAQGAWKSVGSINVAGDVANVVNAWNGQSAPAVAMAAAKVFAVAAPQTPADKAAVVDKIAATINDVATKAPADGKAVRPLSGRSQSFEEALAFAVSVLSERVPAGTLDLRYERVIDPGQTRWPLVVTREAR